MQGIMKFTFLGMDSFPGKKDPTKTFYNVQMLQGSEVAKVFLEAGQEELFKDLEKFDEIECLASWRLGQDKYGYRIEYRIISLNHLNQDYQVQEEENKVTDINDKDSKGKRTA